MMILTAIGRNPYTGEQYLIAAIPKGIMLLQWFQPRHIFMMVKVSTIWSSIMFIVSMYVSWLRIWTRIPYKINCYSLTHSLTHSHTHTHTHYTHTHTHTQRTYTQLYSIVIILGNLCTYKILVLREQFDKNNWWLIYKSSFVLCYCTA